MAEKEKLCKVQFWIGENLKNEINNTAHSFNLATADVYKAGAIMLLNMLKNPKEISLNLYTQSYKDLENSIARKKILKAFQERQSEY